MGVRDSREDMEALHQVLAHIHDGGHVSTPVTVVGGAPDGDDGLVGEMPLVAFIDELMSAGDELQAIDMVELGRDFVAKQPSSASRGDGPGTDIFGVAPDEVAKGAFMRDFLSASDNSDLIERTDFRT